MRNLMIAALVLLGFGTETQAQVLYPWGPGHASTAQEGYLNGQARLQVGRGIGSYYYGQYLRDYESARSQYLRNQADAIRLRWQIQDEYKERNKSENYLDRKERLMDQAVRRHELEQREKELIEAGILPEKKPGYFVYKGKKYESYYAFKESPEYLDFQDEIAERRRQYEAEEAKKKQDYQDSIDFLRMWRKMGPTSRERYGRMSQYEKDRALREFKNPDLRWERYKEEDAVRFYRDKPWLIHKAGKNGYPEASDRVKEIFKKDLDRKLHEARPDLYPDPDKPKPPQEELR